MVRQRTKRWGFDLGGEYILGIAKQELYGEEVMSMKEKTKSKKSSKKIKKKSSEDGILMIKPWR